MKNNRKNRKLIQIRLRNAINKLPHGFTTNFPSSAETLRMITIPMHITEIKADLEFK